MNILVFSWRDTKHPWAGGSELNLFAQAKYWVKNGHKVTVFTAKYEGSTKQDKIDGVSVYRKGGQYTLYIWACLYYIFKFKKNTDVILDIMNGIPFFTPIFSKKPIVALVHHISEKQIKKELPFPINTIGCFLQSKLFPKAYSKTPIISVSESTKDDLLKIGFLEKNIGVIHNGLDHDLLKPTKEKAEEPTVIYLGRLKKYKRISILIKTFAKVSNKVPNSKLIIVGDGDEKESLVSLTKKLKIENKVTFAGFVNEKEKVDYLSKSWVYVTTSLVEGWGLGVLEANACGTGAIAFNVPGLNQSIRNTQTGFLIQDKKELAEKMYSMLTDTKLRDTIAKGAQEWANTFSWGRTARKTEEVFEKIVQKS